LFGRPWAENLYTDLQSAVEVYVDEAMWQPDELPVEVEFEEFDVIPAVEHLLSADAIIDHFVEWSSEYGEIDEDFSEHMDRIGKRDDVIAAAQAFIDVFASHIAYRMAKSSIGIHRVRITSVDEHGSAEWHEVTK
jgi:hypothetical protein